MRASHQMIYPGVYLPAGRDPSARERAVAAWLWSKRRSVVAAQSAAAMLGAKWVDGRAPAELNHDNRRPPPLITVRADTLLPVEIRDV